MCVIWRSHVHVYKAERVLSLLVINGLGEDVDREKAQYVTYVNIPK